MGFYEEISKYYDYIFPTSIKQLDFIKKAAGEPPKSLLDIACGTGGYSIELAKQGYDVTAVDLDVGMVEELKAKSSELNLKIDCIQADMMNISSTIRKKDFDAAFCIGNSIVHLDGLYQISSFFNNVKGSLKDGGSLIVQIINFDRVISKGIKSLPTIYDESIGLVFERFYRYDRGQNKVFFKTILTVNGLKLENEIPLYPLLYEEVRDTLANTGFSNVDYYGDFAGSSFDKDNSYMLVFHAK